MQRYSYITGLFVTMGMLVTACGNVDDLERAEEPVKASMAFAVSNTATPYTRLTETVIQKNEFRGLQDMKFIPFNVQGPITVDDTPKLYQVTGTQTIFDGTNSKHYYYKDCSFMQGVASFLVYARATVASGGKAVNGSLTATFPLDMAPAGISFSLEAIYPYTEAPNDAILIAKYLTDIAQTTGWATTEDSHLKAYYHNFIGQGSVAPSVIASSSDNAKAYVTELQRLIALEPASELRTAILNTIDIEHLNTHIPADFPASIGLPDGAAAVRWEKPIGKTAYEFVPQTVTTTEAPINSLTRFAYPAELYYYTNSQICASTLDNRESYYSNANWGTSHDDENTVLSGFEYDPGIVSNNTKAIAIKQPLQYAVSRLDATFYAAQSQLPDADGTNVEVTEKAFPLTGIIIGGQRPVGFDFKPEDDSDTNVSFVYDSKVNTNTNNAPYYLSLAEQGPIHTLLLQDYDGKDEVVILEFTNNSAKDFKGVDGIIYKGTKFYLIGTIPAPTVEGSEDYKKRVFTQDFTTTVKMKIESLAKAYNVLPNLLSPRLEIGVRLTTDWIQSTPTTVEL